MEVLCLISLILCTVAGLSSGNCGEGATRTRLTGGSGTITNPVSGNTYAKKSKCSWFIENDESASYMMLKISKFDTECLWDYLHVFAGDSIYDSKLAAFSGNLVLGPPSELPTPLPLSNISNYDNGSGFIDTPIMGYSPEGDLYIRVNSPAVLIYFFSDTGTEASGFSISYWTSTCISNCSGRGYCDEDVGVCHCESQWSGEYCQVPICPALCSGNGRCDGEVCVCDDGYTGSNCSISTMEPHWVVLDTNFTLGRGGHSSVVYGGYMWVYGGYQFLPNNNSDYAESGSGSGQAADIMLRYSMATDTWEELYIEEEGPLPRYGHTAIVYKDAMYIYGGALIYNEEITNELWQFNFTTYSWMLIQPTNVTMGVSPYLPVAVKEHTAHIIGDKMVVLFGYPSIFNSPIHYVQEYHMGTRTWSTPPQYGDLPYGRLGHTSVYVSELNIIYVHGGSRPDKSHVLVTSYDPTTYYWTRLFDSADGVVLHSTVYRDGFLLSFGGHTQDCFSDQLFVYDILCNRSEVLAVQGLAGNGSRYGHTAVMTPANTMLVYGGYRGLMHYDLLELHLGGCGRYDDMESCINNSVLCGWKNGQCVSYGLSTADNITLSCDIDLCTIHYTCQSCIDNTNCAWSEQSKGCVSTSDITNASLYTTSTGLCPQYDITCAQYDSCKSCSTHQGCFWRDNTCHAGNINSTVAVCGSEQSCHSATSCTSCPSSCLWCDSVSKCVPSSLYEYSFTYGQCLEWSRSSGELSCQDECSAYQTCDMCHANIGCGWCRDPLDTGIGTCMKGGFLAPLDGWDSCPYDHWFFDQCPMCQCNGHSSCINESICINCTNLTEGDHCDSCIDGYFGQPYNGNTCTECDCNGYNTVCDNVMGNCTCLDSGVGGDYCTMCSEAGTFSYLGDASNFCYYPLSVGFIYTFDADEPREKQTFYVAVPDGGDKLNIKFDITRNNINARVGVQFFLGRASENFMVLYNLTDVHYISGKDSRSESFSSFDSDYNNSYLFSFLQDSLRESVNFTYLLGNVSSSNDYSKHLWDGDVGLVIYVFNVTVPLQYKITVDQTDLLFLLYFFVTFISCFTFLITIFFLGWYIKRKIQYRAFIRAQHIELQRRVRRPFVRIRALAEARHDLSAKQNASYVAVETCRDTRAAVLTLLIRMPGDKATGRPSVNRTGLCFGSTLVKMNPQKKDKKKRSETSRENNV